MIRCDIAVIGAGPAGLGASMALANAGLDVVVVEAGADLDDRDTERPEHLAKGVGGAGLFSDGKFSFHPSASALWLLQPNSTLRRSYAAVAQKLSARGLAVPPFPDADGRPVLPDSATFQAKRYESGYLPLDARYDLMRELAAGIAEHRIQGTATLITGNTGEDMGIVVRTASDELAIRARCVIYAAGRFGPLSCRVAATGLTARYRRVEVGVRIEQP
jgi:uncharacterized FAD-dependent dehydrogenase